MTVKKVVTTVMICSALIILSVTQTLAAPIPAGNPCNPLKPPNCEVGTTCKSTSIGTYVCFVTTFSGHGSDIGTNLIVGNRSVQSVFPDLGTLLTKSLVPTIFTIAGVVAFIIFLFGVVRLIQSGGNPEELQHAKSILMSAIIGLILIFVAYWIVSIVETVTGVKIFNSGL